jgi:hypothetical protein
MPKDAHRPPEMAALGPLAMGGPDDFGYTWDDSVAFSWLDAIGGTDTGMSGYSDDQAVGPVALPFNFNYYENTYNQVWIAASGYLAFTGYGSWRGQGMIPSPTEPNNVVAPYWTLIMLDSSGPTGRVYYQSGGSPPDRYFVVEWYQTTLDDEAYTFEVILHENGDIVFQYQTMSYIGDSYFCGAAGIEDSAGLDGLKYVDFCHQAPASDKAVRFYRPASSARVKLDPLNQGRLTHAGELVAFQTTVHNTGDLGSDTYDLVDASTWPISLYAADGTTSLTDTDGDGVVDTGPVAQGDSRTITVKVQTPGAAALGDANSANVTATSSLDVSKSRTAALQTGVPARFAQAFSDAADGAMSLYLIHPNSQAVKKVTADGTFGGEMAVSEMPGGNIVYVWDVGRCLDGPCSIYVSEIEYTILDHSGNTLRPVAKLTDNSGATMHTYDWDPAVAVAPNGRIGVLWYRELYNRAAGESNDNVFIAILDPTGNVAVPATNLTNNAVWGTWDQLDVPWFYSPRIVGTGDNRFLMAWQREHQEVAGWVDNIDYAIDDTDGNSLRSLTQLTTDGASTLHSANPVSGNRAILTWNRGWDIFYSVLDSAGNAVRGATNLTKNDQGRWASDAAALPDGKTVVAWTNYDGTFPGRDQLAFGVLNSSFDLIAGPTPLNNPIAPTGNAYVSAAVDPAGGAVLTWMDYDWSSRRNLYYALVDGTGGVVTSPMIFRSSQTSSTSMDTSYGGYGNTSYRDWWHVFLPLTLR